MTYPQVEESLIQSRTLLQGTNNRSAQEGACAVVLAKLQSDLEDALGQQDGLWNQIPPVPVGGYTEDAPEELVIATAEYAVLSASLSARIPAE